MSATLRVHHFLPASRANGPGLRAVLWTQGCSLACPGCFNPETHPRQAGSDVPVADLLATIRSLSAEVEGLTISGGEPLQQAPALTSLLREVRAQMPLSVILFTGYTLAEIESRPALRGVLEYVDVVLAGRYDATQHVGRGLLGSANKTLCCLTPRYRPEDFADVPEAEVVVGPDGSIVLTGIAPLTWELPIL